MSFEYKVIPAPARGLKARGVKTPEDRFANALETSINELAADGWEYVRADTLPSEQREGLMSKTTVYQNMLVFRRTKKTAAKRATGTTPVMKVPYPKPAAAPKRVAVAPTPLKAVETPEPPVVKKLTTNPEND